MSDGGSYMEQMNRAREARRLGIQLRCRHKRWVQVGKRVECARCGVEYAREA